ncbi:hypothetical protein KAJ83_15700 [Marivibrio halodurans]|uniref:Uncharacterized protein n=1 Tax=Marivibrio halodurans TaxID=2039722 RepID=A0A8J7V3K5_9PROT|nr:hypothetical protein [Marivibrio halodurans]MBP5858465.1 hypothetical protein [Marivibrio halodurans]
MGRSVAIGAIGAVLFLLPPAAGTVRADDRAGYGAGGPSVGEHGVTGGVAGPGSESGARALPYGRSPTPTDEQWREIERRIEAELEASRRLRRGAGTLEKNLTPPPSEAPAPD